MNMAQHGFDFGENGGGENPVFSVSDFVVVLNQVLEFSFPIVQIQGEVANFALRKDKWVYFDLKDDHASVKIFGTRYGLPGPIENGMMVKVVANPRLHNLYGFSLNFQSVHPVGEGSIKKSFDMLKKKLLTEGLFDASRKRILPHPPEKIAIVSSLESAGYKDFLKILQARWPYVGVEVANVAVQGVHARGEIVSAINYINNYSDAEVIVVIRGGGSADDLAEFSTEEVTRAIAGSRIPTMVAIGHEIDVSLAELAADRRASTPSNAAEVLVPDRNEHLGQLKTALKTLAGNALSRIDAERGVVADKLKLCESVVISRLDKSISLLDSGIKLLDALHPDNLINKGYSITRTSEGRIIRHTAQAKPNGDMITVVSDGEIFSRVERTNKKEVRASE